MTTDLPVAYRAYRGDDENFVYESWIRSFSWQNDSAGPYSHKHLVEAIRGTIDAILNSGASVTVACDPEDDSVIIGWVCFETKYEFPVVHYVYCKDGARGSGLGKALVHLACQGHQNLARYTFKTRAAQSLLPKGRWKPRRNRWLGSSNE